jgi:hypothetical protein
MDENIDKQEEHNVKLTTVELVELTILTSNRIKEIRDRFIHTAQTPAPTAFEEENVLTTLIKKL